MSGVGGRKGHRADVVNRSKIARGREYADGDFIPSREMAGPKATARKHRERGTSESEQRTARQRNSGYFQYQARSVVRCMLDSTLNGVTTYRTCLWQ